MPIISKQDATKLGWFMEKDSEQSEFQKLVLEESNRIAKERSHEIDSLAYKDLHERLSDYIANSPNNINAFQLKNLLETHYKEMRDIMDIKNPRI